jgi:hypothetical protein
MGMMYNVIIYLEEKIHILCITMAGADVVISMRYNSLSEGVYGDDAAGSIIR